MRVEWLAALICTAALLSTAACAADPCETPRARSLVLSGGGSKGAFEAGAAYHLIVHRGCDFSELAGTSVGAINAALIAQAATANDAAESLANLRAAAESLVNEWEALGEPRSVMRTRPLSKIRFALFGLDSVADLEPLREFIHERVALAKLVSGRELRVGLTTFADGRYREIVLNAEGQIDAAAHELIFGSAIVPVFGRMVRAVPPASATGPLQLADGGLRHATPVTSYFVGCHAADDPSAAPVCTPLTGASTPPHPDTEQLFVIITSPFARRNDVRPVVDARAFDRDGTITDGRQILVRTFDLLVDTMYRDDIDDMLTYNELLEWHAQAVAPGVPLGVFPIGSYNRAQASGSRSLPYEIALVAPQREDADPMTIFNLEPRTQRRQLYCGCVAADETMRTQFGVAGMAQQCAARFPGLAAERDATEVTLTLEACLDERTSVSSAPAP